MYLSTHICATVKVIAVRRESIDVESSKKRKKKKTNMNVYESCTKSGHAYKLQILSKRDGPPDVSQLYLMYQYNCCSIPPAVL